MTTCDICAESFNDFEYKCQLNLCKTNVCNYCVVKWNKVDSNRTICCAQKISENRIIAVNSDWSNEMTDYALQFITVPCPRCGIMTEKTSGCNRMSCDMCKTNYLYCCGEINNCEKHECYIKDIEVIVAKAMPIHVSTLDALIFLRAMNDNKRYQITTLSKLFMVATRYGAKIKKVDLQKFPIGIKALERFSVPSLDIEIIKNIVIPKVLSPIKYRQIGPKKYKYWCFEKYSKTVVSSMLPEEFIKKESKKTLNRYYGENNMMMSNLLLSNFEYPCIIGFTVSNKNTILSIGKISYVDENEPHLNINDKIIELTNDNTTYDVDVDDYYNYASCEYHEFVRFIKNMPPTTIVNIKFERQYVEYMTSVYRQLIS